MKKVLNRSIGFNILILFVSAVVLSCIVYPEVFVSRTTGLILWSDYNLEYCLNFILTQFFYQGDLQLWDYFGQMPMAFVYTTYGLFKFQNMVASLLYVLLSPWAGDSAQLIHDAFIWGNLLTSLLLRVIGIFLLLRLVVKDRWIIGVVSVLGAVFFTQPAFLWGTFCFSLLPLGMYFIVRFFQEFQWSHLAAAYLFFVVSLGNGFVHTAGCVYLQLYFFAVSCFVWAAANNRPRFKDFRSQCNKFGSLLFWHKILLIGLLSLVIIGPYLYMFKFCLNDVAFDVGNSRVAGMFSPEYYFKKMEISLIDPGSFFKDMLNFDRMKNPTVFFGYMILCLSAIGICVSRNSLKWIFGINILLLWLLNHPRDSMNLGLIVHWFNALTNPFKTIIRSYLVASYSLLPYLLIPLAALGIEEIIRLLRGGVFNRFRWILTAFFMFLLALTSIPALSYECGVYVLVLTGIFITLIAVLNFKDNHYTRSILVVVLGFLVLVDVIFIIGYSKDLFNKDSKRASIQLDAAPSSGAVGYEVANPKIFPIRQFFATFFSYRDEIYLWFPRGISSDFRHITSQALNFTFINGHCPRHKVFEPWINDPEMARYILNNNKVFFVAEQAVQEAEGILDRISTAGLAHDVVMVDDPKGELNLPQSWSPDIVPSGEERINYSRHQEQFSQAADIRQKGDMMVLKSELPKDFPAHLSTTWFMDDQRFLQLFIERKDNKWVSASQAQGEVVRPFTFDVQNVTEGQLTVAIPVGEFIPENHFALLYPSANNSGVLKLWKGQYDNVGMEYRAARSGWMVFQYPFDKKWKITADGQAVKFYRVNKSFIGFPITAGDHKLLIQYWPETPLRLWLLVSAILTTIGLPVLYFWAFKDQRRVS